MFEIITLIFAQIDAAEVGLIGTTLALVAAMQARQWQRDKKNDERHAKGEDRLAQIIAAKDQYAQELAARSQQIVVNNTQALIELTSALKDRPCLRGDSRANLMKGKEAQP